MKILGLIDLYSAAILLAIGFKFEIPIGMLIFTLGVLFIKSLLGFCMGGVIDMAVGILIILSFFLNLPIFLLIIAAVIIGIKGLQTIILI